MTIRWGESQLRFRLSRAELARLQAEGELVEGLPGCSWRFTLTSGDSDRLVFESQGLRVVADSRALARLAEERNREGHQFCQGGVEVSIQVDLRSR